MIPLKRSLRTVFKFVYGRPDDNKDELLAATVHPSSLLEIECKCIGIKQVSLQSIFLQLYIRMIVINNNIL